jgi:hypothetical protein
MSTVATQPEEMLEVLAGLPESPGRADHGQKPVLITVRT